MTTGSILQDNTYQTAITVNGNPVGTVLAGSYFSKNWAGSDTPADSPVLVENPYDMTLDEFVIGEADYVLKNSPLIQRHGSMLSVGMPGVISGTSLWDSNDDLVLLGKVAAKIRGSDFNLGNFLVEGRQTTALFADTATRIAKMLHYIRDGNLYQAGRAFNGVKLSTGHVLKNRIGRNRKVNGLSASEVSNAILELQYGWKPLISDVHSSMSSLAQTINRPFITTIRVSKVKRSTEVIHGTYASYSRNTIYHVKLKVKYVAPTNVFDQFHLTDPLSALWEVTPNSFVVDWALPVSDYLKAVDLYRTFGPQTILRSEKSVCSVRYLGPNSDNVLSLTGSGTHDNVTYKRYFSNISILSDIPAPVFKSVDKVLSPTHMLNAVALLTAKASRFRNSLKF